MSIAHGANANALLKALMSSAPGPWLEELEEVELPAGAVLHEPYVASQEVFFPLTAVVSLLYGLADGRTSEIAVIGNEGLVGISAFIGDGITPSRAVVQCAGNVLRIRGSVLREEFLRKGPVAFLLLRFTQALIAQMAQTAVCNRHHSVDQQLCRWVLLMLDRYAGNEIAMTHELIADMLGVRRASVSTAAGKLQKDGVIDYRRGRIFVLDRPLIEQRACECYGVVKSEYRRLLPALGDIAETFALESSRHDPSRLAILRQTGILDSPPEDAFDSITRRAAALLDVSFAMVSLLDEDRDWYKSCLGFESRETPAETSFCNVLFATEDDLVVVENTTMNDRFQLHPFVRAMPFIRFYAAARLRHAGHTIGSLCVFDMKARKPAKAELEAFRMLSLEAEKLIGEKAATSLASDG